MTADLAMERPTPAVPRPAATVVLLRPGAAGLEVLLTRRPLSMRFGADLFVFPGGRLDPGEDARAAAVRETIEETGIVIDPDALVPLTRWVTPGSLPIRYDTRFFGTIVDAGTDVLRPSAEVVEWAWLRPSDALEAMAGARLAMWQPTVVTLQQLEPAVDRPTLEAAFTPLPRGSGAGEDADDSLAGRSGVRAFRHAWAGGIEGRPGTVAVVGDRTWVVVDPGDPTGETSDTIAAAADAAGADLAGVLITSLGPARHAGVEMLATGMALPVAGPPGASGRVPYAVRELAEGEAVPFGDARLEVHVERPPVIVPGRWAERAATIRIVALSGTR